MTRLLFVLRLLALMLSMLGYVGFFRAFCAIPKFISFLFSLSILGCAMYFAGLAGLLAPAAYGLFGLGFALLLIVLVTRRMHIAFRRPNLSFLNFMFIVWFAVIVVSLSGYRLIDYDNFSHWALVVKQMAITNAIPDANSVLIDFKNYPLGTASFLYYVSRIVGHSDGALLIGQAMLIFACFYSFFGVVRDEKRFLLVTIIGLCAAIMSFFNVSIRINNLLVDYLLPLFALGAIAGIQESRLRFHVACAVSIPILAFLLIIKNTGLFFAIPCYGFLLVAGHSARKGKPVVRKLLVWLGAMVAIAISTVPLILWNMHTTQAFAANAFKFSFNLSALHGVSQIDWHTFTLQSLSGILTDKTPAQIQSIVDLFIKRATSVQQLATQGLLLINLLALVAWLNARFGFGLRWKLLRVLLLMDALMGVYYIGILLFYIVSMPLDEALRLAGLERYASSMVLFVIGAIGFCLAKDVENSFFVQQGKERDVMAFKSLQTKNIYQLASLVGFSLATLLLVSDLSGMNTLQAGYPETLPAHTEAVLGNHWAAGHQERYLLYAPDTDSQVSNEYLLYIGRYLLFSPNVRATATIDNTLLASIQGVDYFAIVESDEAIRNWMRAHTGLAGDPGIYPVGELFTGSTASVAIRQTIMKPPES